MIGEGEVVGGKGLEEVKERGEVKVYVNLTFNKGGYSSYFNVFVGANSVLGIAVNSATFSVEIHTTPVVNGYSSDFSAEMHDVDIKITYNLNLGFESTTVPVVATVQFTEKNVLFDGFPVAELFYGKLYGQANGWTVSDTNVFDKKNPVLFQAQSVSRDQFAGSMETAMAISALIMDFPTRVGPLEAHPTAISAPLRSAFLPAPTSDTNIAYNLIGRIFDPITRTYTGNGILLQWRIECSAQNCPQHIVTSLQQLLPPTCSSPSSSLSSTMSSILADVFISRDKISVLSSSAKSRNTFMCNSNGNANGIIRTSFGIRSEGTMTAPIGTRTRTIVELSKAIPLFPQGRIFGIIFPGGSQVRTFHPTNIFSDTFGGTPIQDTLLDNTLRGKIATVLGTLSTVLKTDIPNLDLRLKSLETDLVNKVNMYTTFTTYPTVYGCLYWALQGIPGVRLFVPPSGDKITIRVQIYDRQTTVPLGDASISAINARARQIVNPAPTIAAAGNINSAQVQSVLLAKLELGQFPNIATSSLTLRSISNEKECMVIVSATTATGKIFGVYSYAQQKATVQIATATESISDNGVSISNFNFSMSGQMAAMIQSNVSGLIKNSQLKEMTSAKLVLTDFESKTISDSLGTLALGPTSVFSFSDGIMNFITGSFSGLSSSSSPFLSPIIFPIVSMPDGKTLEITFNVISIKLMTITGKSWKYTVGTDRAEFPIISRALISVSTTADTILSSKYVLTGRTSHSDWTAPFIPEMQFNILNSGDFLAVVNAPEFSVFNITARGVGDFGGTTVATIANVIANDRDKHEQKITLNSDGNDIAPADLSSNFHGMISVAIPETIPMVLSTPIPPFSEILGLKEYQTIFGSLLMRLNELADNSDPLVETQTEISVANVAADYTIGIQINELPYKECAIKNNPNGKFDLFVRNMNQGFIDCEISDYISAISVSVRQPEDNAGTVALYPAQPGAVWNMVLNASGEIFPSVILNYKTVPIFGTWRDFAWVVALFSDYRNFVSPVYSTITFDKLAGISLFFK